MRKILEQANLTELERLAISVLCDGPQCAIGLAQQLDLSHYVGANRLIGDAGKKVYKAAPSKSIVRRWRVGQRGGWYNVIAPGSRPFADGMFYWEIRPRVKKAFNELGWCAPPERDRKKRSKHEPRLEGAEVFRLLSMYERDLKLRAACLEIHGHDCAICGFNFGKAYGPLGEGFIHVHHVAALSERNRATKTDPKKDLMPVCPNCHAMIHRGGVTRSLREVKQAFMGTRLETQK
ncbi:MAG: HNH endonuclease [Planctomycetota bacterium]|nr:HNH endonuclease [Planctomycetota bacterium]